MKLHRFNRLEIARESEVTVEVNGKPIRVTCTPEDLKELAAGVAATHFGLREICKVEVTESFVRVCARPRCSDKKDVKVDLEELRELLKLLDVPEYRKTRGYHIAVAIGDFSNFRAYDVSRHSVLAKAIGKALLKGAEVNCVVFSGRISKSIAEMCYNAGVTLIVSKAAIFDSAIEFCLKKGIKAVSFASGVAVI